MPPNRFESEVESFLEGSHGDRTHIKRADHHTVTPLCGTLLPGFRVGRVLSRRWSCVRYKVLPAWLVGGLSGTKFSLQARNGLVSPFCGVWGEFCTGWAHWGRLLGEFCTGSACRVSCGEGFVPEVVLCAVQSSPCLACWWLERYKVLPASEKWLGIAVLWCVGRVLYRVGPLGPSAGRVLYWFGLPGFVWGEFCPGCAFDVRSRGSFVPLIG